MKVMLKKKMQKNQLIYPVIYPVHDESRRPFWSVMIPTYQRPKLIKDTIQSVMKAALHKEDMEIYVVDNYSIDNETEKVVLSEGKGRIKYHQNECNLGIAGNWNKCIELAKGKWVHILHDDDLVDSDYYKELSIAIRKNPNLGLITCNVRDLHDDGKIKMRTKSRTFQTPNNSCKELYYKNVFSCPHVCVRRECYEDVGGFCTDLLLVEDIEMWTRIIQKYQAMVVDKYLGTYRAHKNTATIKHIENGNSIKGRLELSRILSDRYEDFEKDKYNAIIDRAARKKRCDAKMIKDKKTELIYNDLCQEISNVLPMHINIWNVIYEYVYYIRESLLFKNSCPK